MFNKARKVGSLFVFAPAPPLPMEGTLLLKSVYRHLLCIDIDYIQLPQASDPDSATT